MKIRKHIFIYALAAVPAVYVALAYIIGIAWVITAFLFNYDMTPVEGTLTWRFSILSLWGTYIQLPIYVFWALLSKEISLRVKFGWVILLIFLNMLAIPYFLYCKYRNNIEDGFINLFRNKKFRSYLQST